MTRLVVLGVGLSGCFGTCPDAAPAPFTDGEYVVVPFVPTDDVTEPLDDSESVYALLGAEADSIEARIEGDSLVVRYRVPTDDGDPAVVQVAFALGELQSSF